MAKFHGNLLKDSTLSLFNNANIIFPLVSQFDSKMPLVNFFLDTRYFDQTKSCMQSEVAYLKGLERK